MTQTKLANHSNEGRSKIGPWEVDELGEVIEALREVATSVENLRRLARHPETEIRAPGMLASTVDQIRRAAAELSKALGGFALVGAPDVAAELAAAFAIQVGTQRPLFGYQAPEGAIRVNCISQADHVRADGHHLDVAVAALSFGADAPEYVDALLIVRDRTTNERSVRHWPEAGDGSHFDRALDARLQLLGLDEPARLVD